MNGQARNTGWRSITMAATTARMAAPAGTTNHHAALLISHARASMRRSITPTIRIAIAG